MFRLLLPTIIREPQGSTKVTYVFYIYGGNGMVTACRFMYPMFGYVIPGPPLVYQDLQVYCMA